MNGGWLLLAFAGMSPALLIVIGRTKRTTNSLADPNRGAGWLPAIRYSPDPNPDGDEMREILIPESGRAQAAPSAGGEPGPRR